MLIGVAISCHNRNETSALVIQKWRDSLPVNAVLFIVDDASDIPIPNSDFRFETNVGIARTKNKCIELMYDAGCTDMFLADDDIYPVSKVWHSFYVKSQHNHLSFTFNRSSIHCFKGIIWYKEPCGCLLYFKRKCIDVIGGFDTSFKGYGGEHQNFSDRIFNSGLTRFRYIDFINSKSLFHSIDQHNEIVTSVSESIRAETIPLNMKRLKEKRDSSEYIDFRV